nr:rhodanese-like domain-containing protein [uncultured Holophaga sp.]
MGALLGIALLTGLGSQWFAGPSRKVPALQPPLPSTVAPAAHPEPQAPPRPSQPAPALPARPSRPTPASAEAPFREVDGAEAQEDFRLGFPFLDARRSGEYAQGHIQGALSLPVWEGDLQERLIRFDALGHPLEDPVVVYCSGGDCHDSQLLADRLAGLGYRHILIYRGGYPDWAEHGLPIGRGSRP